MDGDAQRAGVQVAREVRAVAQLRLQRGVHPGGHGVEAGVALGADRVLGAGEDLGANVDQAEALEVGLVEREVRGEESAW